MDLHDDRIALTLSGMNAVMSDGAGPGESGDNALVITPSWPNVMRAMEIAGASVREVAMRPSDAGWTLDLDALFAAADARTRVIYLATPAIRPVGSCRVTRPMRCWPSPVRATSRSCRTRSITASSTYRPHALSFLEIMEPDDPVFVINSFSKSWR